MYLDEKDLEKESLRQGDVLKYVQLLGAININSIQFISDHQGDQCSWVCQSKPQFGPAMVLSHSCEIDTANDIKVTSIILAPIRDINTTTSREKIQELIESNYIDENSTFSYLKYFYISPHPLLEYKDGGIVDFSKIFSVRNKSYNKLLKEKIIQVKEEIANKMSLKLSVYYYRNSQSA